MNIDIYIPTGEVRKVKKYEYYYTDNEWYRLRSDDSIQSEYPIGIKHTFEVSNFTERLLIYPTVMGTLEEAMFIPITYRKRKVKTWQWLYKNKEGEYEITKGTYHNEKEAALYCFNPIRPIEETMKEVEVVE